MQKDKAQARKKALTYIRAILTLCLLLLAAYNYADIIESKKHVMFYIIFLVGSNFVFMGLPKEQYEGLRLHYIIFITDIILLSLGTYWMANMDFQFFITMFLTIFICAMSRSIGLSVVIAVVVNLVYLYMKSTMLGGVAPLMQEKVLLNIPFLFIVALHSSYLAESASDEESEKKRAEMTRNRLNEQVKEMTGELEDAEFFTSRVYDSFRDGVIVLDSGGIIKAFNSKCESIFGLKRAKVKNFLYREVKELGGVIDAIKDLKSKNLPSMDREVTVSIDTELKKLIVNTAFIKGEGDVPAGLLCTIRYIPQSIKEEAQ